VQRYASLHHRLSVLLCYDTNKLNSWDCKAIFWGLGQYKRR